MMPQPDRTNAEALDRPFVISRLDVLADPKGVVHQVEHAGDHVANKSCAPKPMATPTTPAPAISGPIWTPNAASAIIAATTMTTTNRTLRKIGSNVRRRARRRASSVFGCPTSAASASFPDE